MKKALTAREQFLLIAAGIAGAATLCWIFLLIPLHGSLNEKESEMAVMQHKLLEHLKIVAQKEQIEQLYARLTPPLKAKGSDEQEASLLQDEVGALAKQTGVKVNKTRPRPMETLADHKRCWIELDCEGTLLQISDFIYRMQNSPQILRVDQLRLSQENPRDSSLRAALLVTKVLILD